MARITNPILVLAAALLAPLDAAQQDAPQAAVQANVAAAPVALPAACTAAGFEALAALARPAREIFGRAAPSNAAALFPQMQGLAAAGEGRALAWCARHLSAAGALGAQDAAQLFLRLAVDHAQQPWLAEPDFDPLISIAQADGPTRSAVVDALSAASIESEAAQQMALLLRAAALAPRSESEVPAAAGALELLAELRARWPAGPLQARAAALAWRIEHLAPGRPAPELTLFDVDGNEMVLSDWRGRSVLVDFWRTGDPELSAHLVELDHLQRRFGTSLRVIGVGLGCDPVAFRRELEELDLSWTNAFDDPLAGQAAQAWHLDGMPTSLLIDDQGIVRAVGLTGAALELALAGAPPAGRPIPERPPDLDRATAEPASAR